MNCERLVGVAIAALALVGCSLLISEDLASEDSPPPNDAGTTDAIVSADGGGPAVNDAGDADAPLDPSLIAFWTFDQAPSSTVPDESGHGHTLIASGAQIVAGAGVRGGALTLAEGQFAVAESLANAAFPKSGTFSIWFKYDWPDDDVEDRGLLDGWDRLRSHVFIRKLGGPSDPPFQAAVQPPTTVGDYAWVRGFDAQRNKWTHLVFTWDSVGKAAALYIDGALVESKAYSQYLDTQPTQQKVRIGDGFIGAIDEVRIYDRVLPAAEALMLP